MTRPEPPNLSTWAEALALLPEPSDRRLALDVLEERWREFPHALAEIEQLRDWTHEGLLAHALAAKAPVGCVPDGGQPGGYTPSFLLTVRAMQLVGKLALACEQALHLEDRQTAIQMMRLMSREWLHLKGEAVLREALQELGGAEDPS